MWLRFKVAMLANLSRKVRQDLAQACTHAAEVEVATVQQEVAGLQDLLQEQQHFSDTLDQVFQVRELAYTCIESASLDWIGLLVGRTWTRVLHSGPFHLLVAFGIDPVCA